MSDLSLVILAAGMGSRYGGLKQLDGVGPGGEVIMEYSIYDAIKAGVNKVIFVIRQSFEEDFKKTILSRLPKSLETSLCYQEFDDLPPNSEHIDPEARQKPWGTGHAVWAARKQVDSPFFAINADDYYGPQAFQRLADHLKNGESGPCMVGFRLSNTLSPSGTVSRGVCEVDDEQSLKSITERTKLKRVDAQSVLDEESDESYPDNSLVSMNCWGFPADFMGFLGQGFEQYLQGIKGNESSLQKGEFYLPAAVDDWRASGQGQVKVLVSEESWLGVTYPEDKETVSQGIRERVEQGVYPQELWAQ